MKEPWAIPNMAPNMSTNVPTAMMPKVSTGVPTKVCLKGKHNSYALNPFHWRTLKADTYEVKINGKTYGRITGGGGGGDDEGTFVPSDQTNDIQWNATTGTLRYNAFFDFAPIYDLILGYEGEDDAFTFNGKRIAIRDVKHIEFNLSQETMGNIQSLAGYFANLVALESIDFGNYFNVEYVYDFTACFKNCYSLKSLDLSTWSNMAIGVGAPSGNYMFDSCYSLTNINIGTTFQIDSFQDFTNMFAYVNQPETEDYATYVFTITGEEENLYYAIDCITASPEAHGCFLHIQPSQTSAEFASTRYYYNNSNTYATRSSNYYGKIWWNASGWIVFNDIPCYSEVDENDNNKSALLMKNRADNSVKANDKPKRYGLKAMTMYDIIKTVQFIQLREDDPIPEIDADFMFSIYYNVDVYNITEVIEDASYMFADMNMLEAIVKDDNGQDTDYMRFTHLVDASYMFANCVRLESINDLVCSSVALRYAAGMFYNCQLFSMMNPNINLLNDYALITSETIDGKTYGMFENCYSMTRVQLPDTFNISRNLEETANMFRGIGAWTNEGSCGLYFNSSDKKISFLQILNEDLSNYGLLGTLSSDDTVETPIVLTSVEIRGVVSSMPNVWYNAETETLTLNTFPVKYNDDVDSTQLIPMVMLLDEITVNGEHIDISQVKHICMCRTGSFNSDWSCEGLFAWMVALEDINIRNVSLNCHDYTGMFYGCSKLKSVDLRRTNLAETDNMMMMFCSCDSLKRIHFKGIRVSTNYDYNMFSYVGANNNNYVSVEIFDSDCYGYFIDSASETIGIREFLTDGQYHLLMRTYNRYYNGIEDIVYSTNYNGKIWYNPNNHTIGFVDIPYVEKGKDRVAVRMLELLSGDNAVQFDDVNMSDITTVMINGNNIGILTSMAHMCEGINLYVNFGEYIRTVLSMLKDVSCMFYHYDNDDCNVNLSHLYMPNVKNMALMFAYATCADVALPIGVSDPENLTGMFMFCALGTIYAPQDFRIRNAQHANMFSDLVLPVESPISDLIGINSADLSDLYAELSTNTRTYGLSSVSQIASTNLWLYPTTSVNADQPIYDGIYWNDTSNTLTFRQVPRNDDTATRIHYLLEGRTSNPNVTRITFAGTTLSTNSVENVIYALPIGYDMSAITSTRAMFNEMCYLVSIYFSNLVTSNVRNNSAMFQSCASLPSVDLSTFDTSNVRSMEYMFYNCRTLASLDLSSFDTSNVTHMNYMFACHKITTLDLSSFNTSNVTNTNGMFVSCLALNKIIIGANFNIPSTHTDMFKFVNSDHGSVFALIGPTAKIFELAQQMTDDYSYYGLSQAPTPQDIVPNHDDLSISALTLHSSS